MLSVSPLFFHFSFMCVCVCVCVCVCKRGVCVCVCVCVCVLCEVGYNFVCVRLYAWKQKLCVCVCLESLCMKNCAEVPLMKSLDRHPHVSHYVRNVVIWSCFDIFKFLQVTAHPVRRVNWTGELPKLDITSLQQRHDPSSCLLPLPQVSQPLAPLPPFPPSPPPPSPILYPAFPSPSPPTILFREKSSRLSWPPLGFHLKHGMFLPCVIPFLSVHGCHFFFKYINASAFCHTEFWSIDVWQNADQTF